jgi:hypothetical protein
MFLAKRVCLAVAVIASAQESIRVTTRLIETSVIVRDAHGRVRDLTLDFFKLFDGGKEQKIAVFRVSKSGTAEPASSAPPLPAGVFSNRRSQAAARFGE